MRLRAILAFSVLARLTPAGACAGRLASDRPEILTQATLVQSSALDAQLMRSAHVPPEDPARREHLTLSAEHFDRVVINERWNFDLEPWFSVARLSIGDWRPKVASEFITSIERLTGAILTLKAFRFSDQTAPIRCLRLGRQHYLLNLSSYRGRTAPRLAPIYPDPLVKVPADLPEQPDWLVRGHKDAPKLPGTWASRGIFSTRLIAEYSPDGEQEIVMNQQLGPIESLQGLWTFDHNFLVLRILLTAEQVRLLREQNPLL